MKLFINPAPSEWKEITKRPAFKSSDLELKVLEILESVKRNGDDALSIYTKSFDGVCLNEFLVSENEINSAIKVITPDLKDAIQIAYKNIEKFHKSQVIEHEIIETTKGVLCWQKSVPIQKVGLYIPGGSAPLFSTVLMLGIPAKIAGCNEIILCSPPDKEGNIHPAVLYCAHILGISKIFKIGGVQAIGAMAYGTESVPAVNKIFGPGNQYVTMAKQLVSRDTVAIDMPAGPSEVAVIADETSIPSFVAADLLSQAEHGPDSQVLLFSSDMAMIDRIMEELNAQLDQLPRKQIATRSLESSRAIFMNQSESLMELVNDYAPEHLIISSTRFADYMPFVINAGSVFLGNYTMESAGDYASGTNHTLPTNGFARSYSGVNLDSFIKKITFQQISPEGLKQIGNAIEIMATEEQLFAHKNAVTLRLNAIGNE